MKFMKRGLILLVILILALPLIKSDITGDTVTGKASAQPTNVSVFILPATAPTLTIISPENKTYLTNISLLLNYSSSNADYIWYSLDSSSNTTITSFLYFNTSQGEHTIFLYANNSAGNIASSNISFVANSTRFTILYDEYKGSTKGNSTNFSGIQTYEELQNQTNIVLENTTYGKILFLQEINLTANENFSDNMLDLDNNTNISFNRIELNSSALPNFNNSATLWLYNLTFSNPRILKDGSVCPSTICTEESYLSRTLKFNVTSFSVYSAEETPTTPPVTPPSGGGGSRGAITTKQFTFTPELIKVIIKKGDFYKSTIKVKNTGDLVEKLKINVTVLTDSVTPSEKEIEIKAGEEKEISLFFSSENLSEGTYTGALVFSSAGFEKRIPIIISVKSKLLLFDVTLNIPSKYKEVKPGEDVMLQVTLFNLGEVGKVDVHLNYYIKDFEGNTIASKESVVATETQASFSELLKLPGNIKEGQYVAGADARYDQSIGTASDIFYVTKGGINFLLFIIVAVIVIVIIVVNSVITTLHFNRKIKEISKHYTKEIAEMEKRIHKGHLEVVEITKIGERLRLQRDLLKKAYEKGYITRNSYENGESRIRQVYYELKKKYL